MSVEVKLPALGESVTEGTVTRWLKNVGDSVAMDEPLLEVSTDKVDTEIPAPTAGVVLEIRAGEDDVVEVGGVLAVIGDASEATAAPAPPAQPAPMAAAAPAAAAPPPPMGAPMGTLPPPPGAPVAPPAPAPAPTVPATAPAPAAAAAPVAASGTDITLPALGESVTEGTVTRWLKSVGDDVAMDEPLLEVSTDKVDTEIPSPTAGTLLEIRVQEDETAEVGAVLAVVGEAGAVATPAAAPPAAAAPAAATTAATPPAAGAAPAAAPVRPVDMPVPADESMPYVTPIVRKMAKQAGVDLTTIKGTGVDGRIRREDVAAAATGTTPAAPSAPTAIAPPAAVSAPAAAASAATAAPAASHTPIVASPLRGTEVKLPRLRRVIAERMVQSLQVSAQLTTVVEADVTRIAHLRQEQKAAFLARHGVKLSFLPFFAYAAVEALKAHPEVNASLDMESGTVTYHGIDNLGMAVETERGLLVPVIRDAGSLSIAGLAQAIADLATRTRANKLSPDDLTGGTFTMTNTGSRGALFDTPIINQPQVAILGTGAVVKRPVVVADADGNDAISVRSMVYLALSYDHRLVDGADAARYLSEVKARLESGDFLNQL